MQTSIASILRAISASLIVLAGLAAMPGNVRAQQDLYVTQLADLVSDGIVSEYPSSGGSAINAPNSPNTGLAGPAGLAISGNNLYVANQANLPTGDDPKGTIKGMVGLYNANTGKAINAQFITGLSKPTGLAVAGNTLYVSSFIPNGTVSAYTANTGAPAPGFTTIPGLSQPTGSPSRAASFTSRAS